MNKTEILESIRSFEETYSYNSDFMRDLFNSSPEGFEKFNNFVPMASYRKEISPELYFIAKIAAMQAEDCGECLQLNIRFAIDASVDKNIIKAVLNDGIGLSTEQKEIYDFALAVARNDLSNSELINNINQRYSKTVLCELALGISSARVFPAIKRTLGYSLSCQLMDFEV